MSALINMPRAAWKRQPQGTFRLTNRISLPDVYCPSFGNHNLGIGGNVNKYSLYDGASVGFAANGKVIKTSEVGSQYARTDNNVMLYPEGTNKSVLIQTAVLTEVETFCYVFSCDSNGHFSVFIRHYQAGNQWGFYSFGSPTGSGEVLDTGKTHTLLMAVKNGLVSFFSNGKRLSGTGNYGNAIGSVPLYINSWQNGGLNNAFINTSLVAISNQDLSPMGESLTENPWQIFVPTTSIFYLIPTDVSVALPTLSSATAVNITSSGFQPRVTATY